MPSAVGRWMLVVGCLPLFLLALFFESAKGCGPDFPNSLLSGGDGVMLAAPVADFERELERLNLAPSRFEHVSATNAYEQQTFNAELSDLAAALRKAKVSGEASARIIEGHRVNRTKLNDYVEACSNWEARSWMDRDDSSTSRRGPQPKFPSFEQVEGLPGEFADYFAGAVAFRTPGGGSDLARANWEQLLARPAVERKYKSTWAAFMLGQSWEEHDEDKAVDYYRMTRDLAKCGFADSTGLAAAALGLEARVELRRKHFKRALDLYLEQYASGDRSAVTSLRWTAAAALAAGGDELALLAASENCRAVVTACLIHSQPGTRFVGSNKPGDDAPARWLEAVEAQKVSDVASAERLALAAYQAGEFELAERWIARSRNTPVAQWLQAKLLLRAGKVAPAAALLANVAKLLPVTGCSNTDEVSEFADALQMDADVSYRRPARRQVWGELGALRLTRGEFSRALDALLRAELWEDAAYVAERVLTVEELKRYVNSNWPPTESARANSTDHEASEATSRADTCGKNIRYLLARRLTRELRSGEAREYYPAVWQPKFDELVVALDEGWNESNPVGRRAKAFFAAACIARTNGMELLGTELSPDWFLYDGQFDWGLTWERRAGARDAERINVASEEELTRASRHQSDPDARFHYRYQAAFLAWEAAKLMPDNDDETARVLCTAGTWLKARDPDTADIFYKALVRRCRKTAIGGQADRMRWFPVLDEAGNPKPFGERLTSLTPSEAVNPTGEPTPRESVVETGWSEADRIYVVHSGDSMALIARAAGVTVKQIVEANPGLESARLAVGQRILIPEPSFVPEPDGASAPP